MLWCVTILVYKSFKPLYKNYYIRVEMYIANWIFNIADILYTQLWIYKFPANRYMFFFVAD